VSIIESLPVDCAPHNAQRFGWTGTIAARIAPGAALTQRIELLSQSSTTAVAIALEVVS